MLIKADCSKAELVILSFHWSEIINRTYLKVQKIPPVDNRLSRLGKKNAPAILHAPAI